MFAAAIERFGGVDILVNNALLIVEIARIPVSQTTIAKWNKVLAVNVTGTLNCAKAAIPIMLERSGGKIVN